MEVRDATSAVYRVEPVAARADDDVPPGYKRTEVGVIPEDWDIVPLNAVAFATSGKRLPTGYTLTDHETPHPYVRVVDMRPGTVSLDDIKYVPVRAFPAIKRYRISADDIFISVAGTLGVVGKVPGELAGANLTENADRITNISCSRDYLLHVLMSPLIQNTINSLQTIGAQPKLALERIRKFDIPLPPSKAEQQAIAEALSDADALIESLQQLIAKRRAIKQGAMHALLTGRQRLSGFTGEWRTTRLGTVLMFQVGCPFGSSYFNESGMGLRLVRNRDLKADDQVIHYSGSYDAAYLVKDGDVLIGMDGDFIPCRWRKGIALLNQRVGRVVPNSALDKAFAFYRLAEPLRKIEDETSSTTVKHLSHGDVEGIELTLPEMGEQTAIAKVLSDMDAEIEALEGRLAKTHALKAGMMQVLLTGKIRLV